MRNAAPNISSAYNIYEHNIMFLSYLPYRYHGMALAVGEVPWASRTTPILLFLRASRGYPLGCQIVTATASVVTGC